MTIVDGRFASEIVTQKGRFYKFDDLQCMLRYKAENAKMPIQNMYINIYTEANKLIDTKQGFYIKHESFKSPMRGNYAAYQSKEMALIKANELGLEIMTWENLNAAK